MPVVLVWLLSLLWVSITGCDSGASPAVSQAVDTETENASVSPAHVHTAPRLATDPAVAAHSESATRNLFTDITAQSGIHFVHETGEDGSYFLPVTTTGGACVFDADNDGLLDIYFVNAGEAPPLKGGQRTSTSLFYSQQNDGTFVDRTAQCGLAGVGYGIGCAVGDLDNDGDLDVYVTTWGENELYRNEGKNRFTNVTSESGISNSTVSSTATFVDYDSDGLLDIYVANYTAYTPTSPCNDHLGRPDYCGPASVPGDRHKLFHNEGGMRFRDVSAESGISMLAKHGLGVVTADFNADGWPDLYVANDGDDNFLWLNNRDGTFTNHAHARGCAVNRNGMPEASMGIAIGDVNNDGLLDLLCTHLRNESNTLYLNDGPGIGFSDRTPAAHLVLPSLPWTGFGVAFLDVDHDGLLDLAVANGAVSRNPKPLAEEPPFWCDYAEPNQLFRNLGNARFEEITAQTGSFGKELEVTRALIPADFDRDGDLDILITNLNGPARLYRNNLDVRAADHSWVQVRAEIPSLKREAVGALVTVVTPSSRQVRPVAPSAGYISGLVAPLHFGLKSDENIDRIEVIWPDGSSEVFPSCAARQVITLRQGEGTAAPAPGGVAIDATAP